MKTVFWLVLSVLSVSSTAAQTPVDLSGRWILVTPSAPDELLAIRQDALSISFEDVAHKESARFLFGDAPQTQDTPHPDMQVTSRVIWRGSVLVVSMRFASKTNPAMTTTREEAWSINAAGQLHCTTTRTAAGGAPVITTRIYRRG